MSFYNMLLGENPLSGILLSILGFTTKDQIPRYRDCYWNGEYIAIYTRTGGGNRDYYESLETCMENYPEYFKEVPQDYPQGPWNSDLRKHPEYVKDEDDDFDSTYATFYFNLPAKFEGILPLVSTKSPGDRFQELMEKLKSHDDNDPDVKRVMDSMAPIIAKIKGMVEDKK